MIPSIVQIGFGLIVVFLLFAYLVLFHRVDIYRRKYRFFLLIWLALTGVLGTRHFFEDFNLPPRIPLFILGFSVSLVVLGIGLYKENGFSRIQQFHLVLFQGFRIPVEILLAMLAQEALLPHEMSFHGRNFDILIGLSALPLAWYIRRLGETKSGKAKARNILILWNVAGLILLSNVVIHGMLAAPYPFQVLPLEPATFVIGLFPVTWLPLFLVPTAYFFHILSLLKIRYDG